MNIPQQTSMRVGMAKVDLFFPYCHSLKEKRHILKKIKDRVWAHFRVSIHEVSHQEKWQRVQLGLAVVSPDGRQVKQVIDKVINDIDGLGLGEITHSTIEVVSF